MLISVVSVLTAKVDFKTFLILEPRHVFYSLSLKSSLQNGTLNLESGVFVIKLLLRSHEKLIINT